MTSYAYRIDSSDTIVWCSESWDDFAVANEAPEACGEAILGHSVWQYFEGFETRHLYRMCFNRVRSGLGDIVLPFRCDGPTTIREMKLRISLCRNKLLQNTGTVIRETPHRLPQFLFQETTRPERIMSICGW